MSVVAGRMKGAFQASMKMEDVTVLSRVKDTACHILINTFIWEHFSSRCYTATETLRLLGDGDLHSLCFLSFFFFQSCRGGVNYGRYVCVCVVFV